MRFVVNRLPTLLANGLLVGVLATTATAADWPNWRGPNHTGISRESAFQKRWNQPIPLVWERDIGAGFSSFACVKGRLYAAGTANRYQTLYCLAADTGEVIWTNPFESEYIERQGGDGPRATPTVDEDRVYMLGARGRLICVSAEDGELVWEHKLRHPPTWGYSGSVLIDADLAIVTAGARDGAILAFDKRTGELRWKSGQASVGYSTPYAFDFEGTRYVAGFLGDALLITERDNGKLVHSVPWVTNWSVNAAMPIVDEELLYLSSGYGVGAAVHRLKRTADGGLTSEQVWKKKVLRNKFQSAILLDGYLYSGDEKGIKCIQLASGQRMWERRREPHATVLIADGHMLALTEDGELIIAPAKPDGFEPLTTAKILGGRCWTIPILCNGKLYARNLTRLVCFDLAGDRAE